MSLITYFFDKEAEHETWLLKHGASGLVIGNLKGAEFTISKLAFRLPKGWGLEASQGTCSYLHRQIDIENGTRTKSMGSFCGHLIASLDSRVRNKDGKQPTECWHCLRRPI